MKITESAEWARRLPTATLERICTAGTDRQTLREAGA